MNDNSSETNYKSLSARLNTILDSIPDIVVEVNKDRIYTWSNQHGYDFFGADMIGKSASSYFVGDQDTYSKVTPLFEGSGETIHLKSLQRRKDGQARLLAWWSHVLKNDQGEVIGAISTARDITDSDALKESLKTSQLLLQNIIDLLPMRIFWKSLDLKYLGCNKVFAQDAGKQDPKELIGLDDFQLSWSQQADLYRSDDLKVIQSGVPKIDYEEPQTTPKGNTIWLNTNKIPLKDNTGKIIGVVGTYLDITDRKKAAEMLENSASRLKRAQAVSHVGNWELDLNTKTVDASEEAYSIYGFDRSEKLITLERVQSCVLPSYRPTLDEALSSLIKTGQEYRQEFAIKRVNDGKIRHIYSIAELVKDENNKPIKIMGTIQDVTELKSVENELRQKNDDLEKMNALMVNRELKMVQLKERVKELEDALQSQR